MNEWLHRNRKLVRTYLGDPTFVDWDLAKARVVDREAAAQLGTSLQIVATIRRLHGVSPQRHRG